MHDGVNEVTARALRFAIDGRGGIGRAARDVLELSGGSTPALRRALWQIDRALDERPSPTGHRAREVVLRALRLAGRQSSVMHGGMRRDRRARGLRFSG